MKKIKVFPIFFLLLLTSCQEKTSSFSFLSIPDSSFENSKDTKEPYQVLLDALEKQASSPYALQMLKDGDVYSKAMKMIDNHQKINSCTYSTPEGVFNENISSGMIHTANRYYDDYTSVTAYEYENPEDWTKGEVKGTDYSYDEHIQRVGKLNQFRYYVIDSPSGSEVKDKYLTSKKEDYLASQESGKREVNAVLIYEIEKDTVLSSFLTKKDGKDVVVLDLNPDTSTYYYKRQMKTTGGLSDYPTFGKVHLEVTLDEEGYPLTSDFYSEYKVKKKGIASLAGEVPTTETFHQYYFHSEDGTFQGKKIDIPKINETHFSGYNLIKE